MSSTTPPAMHEVYTDVAVLAVRDGALQVLITPGSQAEEWELAVSKQLNVAEAVDTDETALAAVRSVMGHHRARIALDKLEIRKANGAVRLGYLATLNTEDSSDARGTWRDARLLSGGSPHQLALIQEAVSVVQEAAEQGMMLGVHDLSPFTAFLPPEMTVSELQAVAEALLLRKLEPKNFRTQVTTSHRRGGRLVPVPEVFKQTGGRPAQAYTYERPVRVLWPPRVDS